MEVSLNLDIEETKQWNSCLAKPLPHPAKTHRGDVDYKKLLAGEKLVYVSEAISHDTPSAQEEMAKILRAAREANPGAKILLASEFLVWDNRSDNLPGLSKYPGIFQQELNNIHFPTLLKKAGRTDSDLKDRYPAVTQAADAAGIDQLALDDFIIGVDEKHKTAIKIGNTVVWARINDKLPQIFSRRDIRDSFSRSVYNLEQTLGASPWGVRERNREWARRIKAVLPEYDMIIVYAGNGHLDATYDTDLQPLVEITDYIDITLHPLEGYQTEYCAPYQDREECLEKNRITQNAQLYRQTEALYSETLKIMEVSHNNLKYDENIMVWAEMDMQEFDVVTNQSLRQEKETAAKAAQLRKYQARFYPIQPKKYISVYLPPSKKK